MPYSPGIGPHTETETINLVIGELVALYPDRYENYSIQVPYAETRQKCDICLGKADNWEWIIEVKMVRFFGDNGKPADTIITHLLSPYYTDHSALSDCEKLTQSSFLGNKAILIYGYDYDKRSLDPAIDAFEVLAKEKVILGDRITSTFEGLIHPVHKRGRVFAWEVVRKSICEA
ncbi:hypothetical protein KDK_07900 [Dictyobacter kobayashii]|uniref:Uncharacterized protein n=2 Tax=Dictyobacter kobayashii TaxID=2014872 RepID=A0A402AD04_9CHLR|nr:hypothetical protein KDK_07900 [Dictyobacter kobayashii]